MNAELIEQRARMVEGQLRTTDVTDPALLAVMGSLPREMFVPPSRRGLAYIDVDIEVAASGPEGPARYLMEPSPFAKLIQLAAVRPSDRVLDVGCGTGYSAAVFAGIAASVTAVEADPVLAKAARANLEALGTGNVMVVEGPHATGYPRQAPYDIIFLGGAVDEVPAALLAQLAEGGRLVAVVGQGNAATARLYVNESGVVSGRRSFNAAVMPLPGFEKEPSFQF